MTRDLKSLSFGGGPVTASVRGIIHAGDWCAVGSSCWCVVLSSESIASDERLRRKHDRDCNVFFPTKVVPFGLRLASINNSVAKSSLRLRRFLRLAFLVAINLLERLLSDLRLFAPLNVLRRGMPGRR